MFFRVFALKKSVRHTTHNFINPYTPTMNILIVYTRRKAMAYQSVFKRYELKYLLTKEQKDAVLAAADKYMQLDKYGKTTIRNIYFDTENYRLIRRSMEKPLYKEKLRIRSYKLADHGSDVFVELKKKYKGVVYKRRIAIPESAAMDWVARTAPPPQDSQIVREIDYFISMYGPLYPSVFLSYDREAYYERDGGDFRVTFDSNILVRQTDMSLCKEAWGAEILDPSLTLMELKCTGGMPLWMAKTLSENKIRKTPFSKYGTAYAKIIFANSSQTFPTLNLSEDIKNGCTV